MGGAGYGRDCIIQIQSLHGRLYLRSMNIMLQDLCGQSSLIKVSAPYTPKTLN